MMDSEKDRFVFRRDPDNGYWIGPDDCHYKTQAHAMYFGIAGLCGCGNPDNVHQLLVDCLKEFDSGAGIRGVEALVRERPEIVAEFIAHFLDQNVLIEHGGSVYGSWLTDLGKQFVEIGPIIDDED